MTNNTKELKTRSRIRSLMKRNKVTQEELASEMGYARTTLTQKLSGDIKWFADDFYFLGDYFNCSVDYLMGLSDDPKIREAVPSLVGA